jgi:inorganic pyrophosphatase
MSVYVVIETPAGSRTKYKWEPKRKAYVASKVLPLGMAFPFDFGFIPDTKADDGDPLDALVIADAPLVVGCHVKCRVLGAVKIKTDGEENDRLICVPTYSLRGADWKTLDDIGSELAGEITAFFESYVAREGRDVEVRGQVGADAAKKLLKKAAR